VRSRKIVTAGLLAVCAIGVLWVYWPAPSSGLASYASKLKLCTRVELEYRTSALENFEVLATHPGLLSPDERAYLQSLKISVVSDPAAIERVADTLSWTSCSPVAEKKPEKPPSLTIRGYRDGQGLVSLGVYDRKLLITDDGQTFELRTWPEVPSALQELSGFYARGICAQNLLSFARALRCGPGGAQRHVKASEWCESIWPVGVPAVRPLLGHPPTQEETRKQRVQEAERGGAYRCPTAGEGRCHYAMNPDCGPNSPPDTVLIFEAYAGWNQHGGPELFTFDHHDPRGGCVLLNNGTVMFIRTEEELKQLRWK
jgi:hypothetical protein